MEKFKGIEVRPGVVQMLDTERAINKLIDENEKLKEAIRFLAKDLDKEFSSSTYPNGAEYLNKINEIIN